MTITPVELRNFQFAKKMRGYDPVDVDAMIDEAAGEMENLIAAGKRLDEEVKRLQDRLKTYEGIEQSLRQALVTAEEAARQQQEAASKEAQLKLREVEVEVERRVADSRNLVERAKTELAVLRQEKITFVAEMRSLIETHLRLLEGHAERRSTDSAAPDSEPALVNTQENGQSDYGSHHENQ